jgi:phosphohistidine phosphatase
MDLYFLRHGVAVDLEVGGGLSDAERPLTAEGQRKMRAIAKGMSALELSFDLVLSSPALRAWQTARIAARGLNALEQLKLADCLAPGADPKQIVENLRRLDPALQRVLLVGHEPDLSQLVSLLVAGNTSLGVVFKKGGLCKLAVESLKPSRCAALEWLLTPKQLIALA